MRQVIVALWVTILPRSLVHAHTITGTYSSTLQYISIHSILFKVFSFCTFCISAIIRCVQRMWRKMEFRSNTIIIVAACLVWSPSAIQKLNPLGKFRVCASSCVDFVRRHKKWLMGIRCYSPYNDGSITRRKNPHRGSFNFQKFLVESNVCVNFGAI